jgi:sensor histidine kinase YesM
MRKSEKYTIKNQVRQSILIFLFGGLVMGYFMCRPCFRDFSRALSVIMFSGSMWLFLWKGNEYIYIITDRFVSWFKTPMKRMFIGLGLMIVYSSTAVTALTLFFFTVVFKQEINEAFFASVRESVIYSIVISTIIMLFFTARGFLLSWRQAAINIEKIKREHVSSQYEALKNQVNPHFLFNSLNALSSLVYDHPDRAIEFINRLSDVYRYVLDSKDKEAVPVNEELDFVRAYSFLLKTRYEDNIEIEFDVTAQEGYVPPMSIQMLLENVVKHNEISDEHPMRINIKEKDSYIFITNRLHLKEKNTEMSGIGLENIKSRYSILTDRSVQINQTNHEFVVGLPILQID